METKLIKVGIIGLGLIGSSLLKVISEFDYEIYCVSKSSYKKAKKYCYLSSNDLSIVKNCDIIFVCCDISNTLKTLDELNKILPKRAIVVDVASYKGELINKNYNFHFILSHPMAGNEKTGFEAGDKKLFIKSKWLIAQNNKILNEIIKNTGAIPYKINMKNHDEMVAQISHLPTILSFLLFDSVDDYSKGIASSGFRDTTRLAMTSSSLALNMFKNKDNILKYFDIIFRKMKTLEKLSDDEKIKYFEKISELRSKMYDENGKNIYKI